MALSDYFKFWNAKDATALTTDIRSAETAYVDSGKLTGAGVYEPGAMRFNGTSAFLMTGAPAWSGNAYSAIIRVKNCINGSNAYLFAIDHGSAARDAVIVNATSHRPDFYIYNSAGTLLDTLLGLGVDLGDGEEHILLLAVDGATGAACFYEGHTQLDTGALGAFTLGSGGGNAALGSWHTGATSWVPNNTEISYFGYRRAYIDWTVEANRLKFLTANGHLKQINESSWTEWGAQPEIWNPRGALSDNRGSLNNFNWVNDVKLLVGTDVVPTFPLPKLGNVILWMQNPIGSSINDAYDPKAAYPTGSVIVSDSGWAVPLSATDWDLNTSGFAFDTTNYAAFTRLDSGPSIPATGRRFRAWARVKDVALTNNGGLYVTVNMADISTDYWVAYLVWSTSASAFFFVLAERTASVTTNRATYTFPTTITTPAYVTITVEVIGDTICAHCSIWEYDASGSGDIESKSLIYSVGSRANKTATGLKLSLGVATSDVEEWQLGGALVEDLK